MNTNNDIENIEVECHGGENLDEQDYDELLCNCYGILSQLIDRKLPKLLMSDIRVTLQRLDEALGDIYLH